jgi:hypothetical protein
MSDANFPNARRRSAWESLRDNVAGIFLIATVLVALSISAAVNDLLFHALTEGFSIVLAGCVFLLVWNARQFLDDHFLLFAGIAYLFVAALDTAHLLTYPGIGVFQEPDLNHNMQFFLSARFLESFSLMAAPFFVRRKFNPFPATLIFAAVAVSLIAAVRLNVFPACYVDGEGLTPFMKYGIIAISLVFFGAIIHLYRKRDAFHAKVFRLMEAAIIAMIPTNIALAFFEEVNEPIDTAGHLLKIVSFYLIYLAIIQTGLVRPYDLLFRNLKKSGEALSKARDQLERRVRERTAELIASNEKLRRIIDERLNAENALRNSELKYRTLVEQLPVAA